MKSEQTRVQVLDQEYVNRPIDNITDVTSLSKDSRCDDNMHYLVFETEASKQVWCIRDRTERENIYKEYLKQIKQ